MNKQEQTYAILGDRIHAGVYPPLTGMRALAGSLTAAYPDAATMASSSTPLSARATITRERYRLDHSGAANRD